MINVKGKLFKRFEALVLAGAMALSTNAFSKAENNIMNIPPATEKFTSIKTVDELVLNPKWDGYEVIPAGFVISMFENDKLSGGYTASYVDINEGPTDFAYVAGCGHTADISLDDIPIHELKFGEVSTIFNKGLFISKNSNSISFEGLADTESGIFTMGNIEELKSEINYDPVQVGIPTVGEATMLSTIDGNDTKEYLIEITEIDPDDVKVADKDGNVILIADFFIKVLDEDLISKAGGLCYGMSGSPIMQNGKIVGVETFSVSGDRTRGGGIFITDVLEAQENVNLESRKKPINY